MRRLSIYIGVAAMLAVCVAFASNTRTWPFSAPTVNGSSSVANPAAGNIIFDVVATAFKGFDGTTWVTFGGGGSSSPVGTILAFGGSTAPAGFLIANGAAVSRTTYSELYTAIGDAFGAGDGVNTFNLPDLRGRFMRGVDDGAANDPDAGARIASNFGGNTGDSVGSLQDDAFQSHTHNAAGRLDGSSLGSGSPSSYPLPTTTVIGSPIPWSPLANAGGNETRPKNVYVNYIIKY